MHKEIKIFTNFGSRDRFQNENRSLSTPVLYLFCDRMIREAGLAVIPGRCFGTEGYIRISYCYRDEELKTGMDRLEAFIHSLR